MTREKRKENPARISISPAVLHALCTDGRSPTNPACDGKETWRTSAGGVCQAPLYIKLSDEIGKWGGDIAKATLPDEFLVDYVRVYDLVDMK